MSADSPTPTVRLGDYRLLELLSDSPPRRTWLAEQVSVGRQVLLDELDPESPETAAAFLADVRAKASVDHPLIGSVYEAVTSDNHCFCAREKLNGSTLQDLTAKAPALKPVEVARVLRKVAEANLHLEGRSLAASPLLPEHVHLDERGVVRLANLVTTGTREPGASQADLVRFGLFLPSLLAQGHPGTTRLVTLLSWMAGADPNVSLNWAKVRDYAQQIDQQLAEPLPAAIPPTSPVRPKRFPTRWILAGSGTILALAALAFLASRPKPPPPHSLPSLVEVPTGDIPGPDGPPVPIRRFWLAGHETTIRQYAEFLQQLQKLDPSLQTAHDAENQPATKTDHLPTDWENLYTAASNRSVWNGRAVDLDCPVVGVDWWDAAAFCDWAGGRLPAQEEWFAAIAATKGQATLLKPAPWGPVASCPEDRTPGGLHDMAGSVAEWTRRPAANPALPMAPKQIVISGGSFLQPATGAKARNWTDDRSLRRPDLGFRVAYDHPPGP